MWVQERNGKFIARERYRDYMTGKDKIVSVTMDRDTPQARNKASTILSAKIAAAQAGDPQESRPVLSLAKTKNAYLDYQKKTVKDSTYTRNQIVLDTVTGLIGDDVLMDRLSAGWIMSKLLATEKEPGSINNYLIRLRAMLRWAYENDLCDNIAAKLKLLPDKTEREKVSEKYLEREELELLLDGLTVTIWHHLTRFLVLSGLRIGEALALLWSDLDLDQRLIHVSKTLNHKTLEVTSPKTFDSVRDVYMQDDLLALCRQLLAFSRRRAMEFGHRSELLFATHDGQFCCYDVYEKYLKERSEDILGRRVTSHVMRHTMTALFVEAGVPLEVVSRRLGHHDSQITRDIYFHVTEKRRQMDYDAVREVSII